MKICWLGWLGPYMDECSQGLLQFDPNMMYYIIGRNGNYTPTGNVKMFTNKDELFSDLARFDVIIYDTYAYSLGDWGTNLQSFIGGNGCVTQWLEWGHLKAKKILFDAESISGKMDWFIAHTKFFDHTITDNPAMPGYYAYFTSSKMYENTGPNNEIKVLYTGSFTDMFYRKQLADFLRADPRNVVTGLVPGEGEWLKLLNRSKMYLATYSCASGQKYPMGLKPKECKALLCGALPLTEEYPYADRFLIPEKERVTFKDFADLRDKINYYDTHEDERLAIVAAGRKKFMEELTNERMWRKAFQYFNMKGV
jgi:hypothetical protein